MYSSIIKPFLDVFCAIIALGILSPIFILITVILAVCQKRQVFFVQERPGKNEKIFKLIKFKTMIDVLDENGELLPDNDRLTLVGKIIRKTSFDELPQLINIIRRDMSFIGPRPLLVEYLRLYNEEQKRRHKVTPGITGWAQVNGRNTISWEKKFEYDLWYVDNQTIWLDIKIFFLTISKVFKAEGISADGHVTIERFEGSKNK